jgi:hypothetical protein
MLNEGESLLKLAGHHYLLRPTLRAMKELSTRFGGLSQMFPALQNNDFDGIVDIIRIGAGLAVSRKAEIEAHLYATGFSDNSLLPVVVYVQTLMNGGRPLPDPNAEPPPDATPATEGNESP